MVQVDLFLVDSLEYVSWAMYSPSERESKYKSAVRNQLITQTVHIRSRQIISELECESELYNLYKGIYKINTKFMDENGQEQRDPEIVRLELLEDDPDEIASKYFGATVEDIESAESTIEVLKDDPDFPEICWRIVNLCVIKKEIPLPLEIHEAADQFHKEHMKEVLEKEYDELSDLDAYRKREWWSGNEIEREWQEWKAAELAKEQNLL